MLTSIPILKFLNFSPNKCELPSGFVSHPGKSCSPFPPQLPAPQLSIATLLMTPTSFRTVPLSPTEHHSPTFPLSSHINLPRTSHIQPFQKQSHYLLLLGGSTPYPGEVALSLEPSLGWWQSQGRPRDMSDARLHVFPRRGAFLGTPVTVLFLSERHPQLQAHPFTPELLEKLS